MIYVHFSLLMVWVAARELPDVTSNPDLPPSTGKRRLWSRKSPQISILLQLIIYSENFGLFIGEGVAPNAAGLVEAEFLQAETSALLFALPRALGRTWWCSCIFYLVHMQLFRCCSPHSDVLTVVVIGIFLNVGWGWSRGAWGQTKQRPSRR